MRRLLLLSLLVSATVVSALVGAGTATAHPLGNFTVNHFAAVDLAGNGVFVRYALDLAEIPTFQEGAEVRRPGYAAKLASKLELVVDGTRVPLVVVSHRTSERPGAGGLKTMRFDAVFRASVTGTRLTFSDAAYASRIGWREIVVTARNGAGIVTSSVPATSRSQELRAYPKTLLRSPLDVRSASVRYTPGLSAAAAPTIGRAPAPDHGSGGFESLIRRGDLSVGVILLSLLIAAFWGSVHALTPGHGKALVAGYLVGTKGKPRHAFLLGATVTLTHTAGVFGLGLVTLVLSRVHRPRAALPLAHAGVGAPRRRGRCIGAAPAAADRRLVSARPQQRRSHARWPSSPPSTTHDHGHHHHHGGDDAAHEHHGTGDPLSSRGILGVGVAAGLLPCPSALVVLLSAIALHRIGFGFALITAFSFGLAATITGIGLVAVLARRALGRVSFEGRLVRALPALSALVILGVGVALTVRALPAII